MVLANPQEHRKTCKYSVGTLYICTAENGVGQLARAEIDLQVLCNYTVQMYSGEWCFPTGKSRDTPPRNLEVHCTSVQRRMLLANWQEQRYTCKYSASRLYIGTAKNGVGQPAIAQKHLQVLCKYTVHLFSGEWFLANWPEKKYTCKYSVITLYRYTAEIGVGQPARPETNLKLFCKYNVHLYSRKWCWPTS